MADYSHPQGDFPTMGTSVPHCLMNMSGKRSPYTKTVAKKTEGRGSSPTGRAAVRGSSVIHEANGPKCTIVTRLYSQNAAQASDTQRNTKMLPHVVSRPDHVGSAKTFWDKRQYGQRT